MFLEGLDVTVKSPTTATQALHVLGLSPERSEKRAQRIFLELFMHFGGTTKHNHLKHAPVYRLENTLNGREQVLSIGYIQPPFCPSGWYISEFYKDIPEEKEISLIEDKELKRLKNNSSHATIL